jgi:hypothetical protein
VTGVSAAARKRPGDEGQEGVPGHAVSIASSGIACSGTPGGPPPPLKDGILVGHGMGHLVQMQSGRRSSAQHLLGRAHPLVHPLAGIQEESHQAARPKHCSSRGPGARRPGSCSGGREEGLDPRRREEGGRRGRCRGAAPPRDGSPPVRLCGGDVGQLLSVAARGEVLPGRLVLDAATRRDQQLAQEIDQRPLVTRAPGQTRLLVLQRGVLLSVPVIPDELGGEGAPRRLRRKTPPGRRDAGATGAHLP